MQYVQGQNSPIIIIDDDQDDLDLISTAHQELNVANRLILFTSPNNIFDYLKENPCAPFLIISEYHLPMMNGIELKRRLCVHDNPEIQIAPFIIWSASIQNTYVREAFSIPISGFFVKPSSYSQLLVTYSAIISYWQLSLHAQNNNIDRDGHFSMHLTA